MCWRARRGLTAIGSLIPLILEHSSLYSRLAIVILGGLVSSTLLARVITPVLYKLLAPAIEPTAASVPDVGASMLAATTSIEI